MDAALIFPREVHETLAHMGRVNWLTVNYAPKDPEVSLMHPHHHLLAQLPAPHNVQAARLVDLFQHAGHGSLLFIEAAGACLAEGPKIFQPTEEQFDSMRQVEIHLPIADYRQPYPTMVVRIPKESRRRLAEELHFAVQDAPQLVLLRCRDGFPDHQHITIVHRFCVDRGLMGGTFENIHTMLSRNDPGQPDIEHYLNKWCAQTGYGKRLDKIGTEFVPDEAGRRFCQQSGRAALNLILMLIHFGCQQDGPLVPKVYQQHRTGKRPDPVAALADFTKVKLLQDIVVRKHDGPRPEAGEPTGREMPTHWRRGHWRRQPSGVGRSERKLVFIRPVLVRADRNIDTAQTQTTYHT